MTTGEHDKSSTSGREQDHAVEKIIMVGVCARACVRDSISYAVPHALISHSHGRIPGMTHAISQEMVYHTLHHIPYHQIVIMSRGTKVHATLSSLGCPKLTFQNIIFSIVDCYDYHNLTDQSRVIARVL